MTITPEIVKKVARLSRLYLSEADVAHYTQELNGIMNWIEQLQEVNTDGVEPMAAVGNMTLRYRDDVVNDGNQQQAVLANAPSSDYGCFVVPKVLE
jgi:aspartyl-tRNA(Asn)/glutamyl-tRNA(Gln) amidotransferase subunit C